jgi:hypothetical protein
LEDKMNDLKSETVNKCFSLLREFIEETPGVNNKRGVAILALNQLRKVTAGQDKDDDDVTDVIGDGGTQSAPDFSCIGHPRADGTPPPPPGG